MVVSWFLTFSLSVYITVNRPSIPESEALYFFIVLLFLAILSTVLSYIHLTILSPLSDVRSRIKQGIEKDIEEEIEE